MTALPPPRTNIHPKDPRMVSRWISGTIAIACLTVAYVMAGGQAAFYMGAYLILPLACIWFGDELGSFIEPYFLPNPILYTTPGSFVRFGGWILLAAPGIWRLVAWRLS